MNLDWQNVAAMGLVVGAIAYVTRRIWRAGRSKWGPQGSCCSACGPRARQNRLVSLEPPRGGGPKREA